ncbi:hypothetical protein CARUB_v10021219mg [Capsella rubella]|uniref:Uncharacterized protein n=1 Tax=Capsella rubella TaxID=81985 RepID=R0I190_9BRAS|nr:hypothetical protein CARUB_v10021219mg [Capsella rubella]
MLRSACLFASHHNKRSDKGVAGFSSFCRYLVADIPLFHFVISPFHSDSSPFLDSTYYMDGLHPSPLSHHLLNSSRDLLHLASLHLVMT